MNPYKEITKKIVYGGIFVGLFVYSSASDSSNAPKNNDHQKYKFTILQDDPQYYLTIFWSSYELASRKRHRSVPSELLTILSSRAMLIRF